MGFPWLSRRRRLNRAVPFHAWRVLSGALREHLIIRTMSKNLKDKSYNEVMNAWAAQRSFLQRASTGLFRPPYGTHGVWLIWGWLWRVLILVGLPILFYMGILRLYTQGTDFSLLMARQTKRFLDAENVTFGRSRWDLDGELRAEHINIKGSKANIFHDLVIGDLRTVIPVPQVFKSAWHLDFVDTGSMTMTLRSGGAAPAVRTAAAGGGKPDVLTAGWGIKPDFSELQIDRYTSRSLTLRWGGTPATRGELTNSSAALSRTPGGWELLARDGSFRQGWLDQIHVGDAKINIGSVVALIEKASFTVTGGGTGALTGSIALGEVPDIKASIKLENIPFHQFLPEFFDHRLTAICYGEIALSGSTNLTAGILMKTRLTVQSGSILGIPILRALELATGDTKFAHPDIAGGHIHFSSQGTQESGGLIIDADDVVLDCGTQLKISLTLHHEARQVIASTIRESSGNANDTVTVSTGGVIRIGLTPETVATLKPAIVKEFITREEQGYQWMEIPYRSEENGLPTKAAADRIIDLHNAGN